MNRLVDALLDHPDVVDLAVQSDAAGFELLVEELGDALLSRRERYIIVRNAELRSRLCTGYLPIMTAVAWNTALNLTQGDAPASGWWTVMIASTTGHRGLTAPQDSSDVELIALFAGPAIDAVTLVYN